MPPFGSDKKFDSLYTPKEPTLSGSSTSKPRGSTSSRDVGKYNLSNPFLKKPSNPLIFGYGNSAEVDLTTDSSKNKTVIGQSANINQSTIEQIKQDSKENLSPDVTKSATAPEKVVEDVIKKINKAEASYNYIPPSFETFLLQNSKNKVLFNFIRPTFSYNLKLVSPADQSTLPQFSGQDTNDSGMDENPNLIPLDQTKIKQIDISNFSLLFYKTKNKPSSIEEITSESNLFKELTPAKKELSIIDFLDVNTDYYFYVIPEQNLIDKISSLIVTEFDLSLGDFKVTTAGEKGILSDYVYRIKVIKDGELYFLEKEAINLKEIKDTKKTKSFFGTFLVEPKYNFVSSTIKNFAQKNAVLPFTTSDSVFDSGDNYPYIKFRFKSKKSNRKVDINLKYTILNSDPVKLNEQQISQDKVGKYTKLKSVPIIVPTMFIGDTKYNNFLSSSDSRLSGVQFAKELKKIISGILKNTNVLADDTKIEDFIVDPVYQKDIDIIKNNINKNSSIYKLFNKGKLEQTPSSLFLDLDGFKNFDNSRESGMIGVSLDNQKSFINIPFYTKSELEIFKQAVESYSPSIFIEYDPNFKFIEEFKGMRIYNASIQDLISVVNNSFLKEIYYKYPNNIFENAKSNFLLLINNLKQEKETSMYIISKSVFINFLASQDSREVDLLKSFINELNSYYSSDNSKSIIYVYNGKDEVLYSFVGYTKQDLDKFINDYPDDNYLKQIYVNLIKNIEPGKDIVSDAILQL